MDTADYLLIEDDCAPDARDQFEKILFEKYDLTMDDFRIHGESISHSNQAVKLKYRGYILESFADAPYWHLRRVIPYDHY